MTLQQILYFITVAECGSVGQAAKKLFISASTISESLAELEKEYNVQAFVRGSRGMALTREGQDLLLELSAIQQKLNYLSERYKNKEQIHCSLDVVAQHHICGMDSFLSFVNMYSNANYDVSYKESSTTVVLNEVELGRADVGIAFCTVQSSKQFKKELTYRGLEFHKLLTGKIHAYMSTTHPLAYKDEVTIEDLMNYPQISYDRLTSNGEYTNFKREKPARQTIAVTDRATAYSLIRDLRAFIVGTGLKISMEKKQQIRIIPVADGDLLEIGYILKAKVVRSTAVNQFITLLEEEVLNHLRGMLI